MTVELAVLFKRLGSVPVEVPTAVLVRLAGVWTRAVIVSVPPWPLASVPTVQIPEPDKYVPCVAENDTNVSPLGRTSFTITFVAVSGPLFCAWTVKTICDPTRGAWLLTLFVTTRSALGVGTDVGAEMVVAMSVTAVCANALPFSVAPFCIAMFVLANMIPSTCEPGLRVTAPATCQKMFLAWAPPTRRIFLPVAISRVPVIWKTQTSFAPPERVRSVVIVTLEPQV